MGSRRPEHHQHLIGLAQRRAFETYLRFGRMLDNGPRLTERKALNPAVATPAAAPRHATSFYVWRSAGDNRVRHSHAARDGQLFAWAEPPAGGHPGSEPNCRCWAEPYYGDPSVPDNLQPLSHALAVDTTGTQQWASTETLTRPDGSLAHSVVIDRDGRQIRTRFSGTLVARTVTLPSDQTVRIDTESGVQSLYLGNERRPLFRSAWTANGPRVVRARQRVAFLGDRDTFIDPDFDPLDGIRDPFDSTLDPNPAASLLGPGDALGLGIIGAAMLAVYAMQQAMPASQGLGESDEPVAVVKTWTLDLPSAVSVLIDAQTEERFRQNCKHREAIERWAIEAIARAKTYQDVASPQTLGTRSHLLLRDKVELMRKQFPELYGSLRAEISFVNGNEREVPYGTKGSIRLDILEDRRDDMGAICVYDMKTGTSGLTLPRIARIGRLISNVFPGTLLFYVTQVGPMAGGRSSR